MDTYECRICEAPVNSALSVVAAFLIKDKPAADTATMTQSDFYAAAQKHNAIHCYDCIADVVEEGGAEIGGLPLIVQGEFIRQAAAALAAAELQPPTRAERRRQSLERIRNHRGRRMDALE